MADVHGVATRAVVLAVKIALRVCNFTLGAARRARMTIAEAASERCDGCEREENYDQNEPQSEACDLFLTHGRNLLFSVLEFAVRCARLSFKREHSPCPFLPFVIAITSRLRWFGASGHAIRRTLHGSPLASFTPTPGQTPERIARQARGMPVGRAGRAEAGNGRSLLVRLRGGLQSLGMGIRRGFCRGWPRGREPRPAIEATENREAILTPCHGNIKLHRTGGPRLGNALQVPANTGESEGHPSPKAESK